MTCINTALTIADIPAHWQPPLYQYGQVIVYNNKFCEIIGRRYLSPFSAAGKADPQIVGGITRFMSLLMLSTPLKLWKLK